MILTEKAVLLWCVTMLALTVPMTSAQSVPPFDAPKTMKLCVSECQNLVWSDGKYLGFQASNPTPVASYTIVKWDPSEALITGTSLKRVPLMGYLTAVYHGKVTPGSLSDPTFEWHLGKTSGKGLFQLTWDVASTSSTKDQSAPSPAPQNQNPPPPPVPPPPPPPDSAPAATAPTAQITVGQTSQQVVDAIGKPLKIVTMSAKQIYVYKDMKVTFVDNKVTDVE